MTSIWFRPEYGDVEKVDTVSEKEALMMLNEYAMAFGCGYGQHRHGKDKLWVGLKRDEPRTERC